MTDAKPLRVGLIGAAGFGGYRRERLREAGVFQLVSLCDRDPDALAKACAEEQATGYDDLERMLDETPGIEALIVSTGADSHAAFALAAMSRGLHVFVEKPLCTGVREVEQLRRAQHEAGVVVGVGHANREQDPVHRMLPHLMEDERLGTLACYEVNSSHSGGLDIKPGDWRGLADRNPGGMLFQCGVHSLHQLVGLFGPVEAVQAMMRYDVHHGTQTADVAHVVIRHTSGMTGTLNCYHVTGYQHAFRLFGTQGNLYVDTHEHQAWYQARRHGKPEHAELLTMPPVPPEAACLSVKRWYDAIRQGGAAAPSLEDGVQAVLPVFAAELAAKERRAVALSELVSDLSLPVP